MLFRRKIPLFRQNKIAYLLNDNFTDTRAAGAVNGTPATPTGGARTCTDTNSKISIGSGVLSFATGEAVSDAVWYTSLARTAGRTLLASVTITSGSTPRIGWDSNSSGAIQDSIGFVSGGYIGLVSGAATPSVGAFATSTVYRIAAVMRATGIHWFIRGGTFTNWTMLYPSVTGGTGAGVPVIGTGSTTAVYAADFMRVPLSLVLFAPIASDAFTRANGALGNTGGGGSEESGGSGLAWTAQAGTWGVATNKAACSALTGAGFATANASSVNVMIEAVVTRSAGNAGLVARYADANNYIIAYHDGTNMHLDKVVAGTPTSLINAATTYSATARTILSLSGTGVRLYYNEALVGAQQTVSDAGLQTGTAHGLYTTDTGATFDNFVVWAKGVAGEYDGLLDKFTV